MPNDIRVNPAARSAARPASVTVSGFASAVTSAPGASPNSASTAPRIAPSWAGGSRVGVPPPKNTVRTGGAPIVGQHPAGQPDLGDGQPRIAAGGIPAGPGPSSAAV